MKFGEAAVVNRTKGVLEGNQRTKGAILLRDNVVLLAYVGSPPSYLFAQYFHLTLPMNRLPQRFAKLDKRS